MASKAKRSEKGGTSKGLLGVTMLLMRAIAAQMRYSERHLAPAQVGILAKIGEGPCTLSDLARHQAVRLPTISRSVSMLVDRGLVQRWTPAHNRRQSMVELTAEGRAALAAIKREAERHVDAMLAHLSGAERAKVHDAIEILSLALRAPGTHSARGKTRSRPEAAGRGAASVPARRERSERAARPGS